MSSGKHPYKTLTEFKSSAKSNVSAGAALSTTNVSTSFKPSWVLNFRSINTLIHGHIGYKDSDKNAALSYVAEKPGGSDVGHVVAMENSRYIIKIGVTLSLLGQALKKSIEGRADKERQYLGFIIGNFTRIAGNKHENHPELIKILSQRYKNIAELNLTDILLNEMTETFNQFKQTESGKIIQEKLKKSPLTTNDIYVIYRYLISQNVILSDVVSLAALADVISGAYGQFFNNAYQERIIPREMLDDHRLLIEKNDNPAIYMASRFNSDAEPFDKFLLKPFISNELANFSNKQVWLDKCKKDLSSMITHLHGLGSSILIRHIMGESGDLGPDNMLLISQGNNQYIVNIDVTGFRYPRRNTFQDKQKNETRLGWEDTLKTNDQSELVNCLFNSTVFCNRFIWGSDVIDKEVKMDVMQAIIEVLVTKVNVENEVQDVCEWLRGQQLAPAVNSLQSATEEAYGALNSKMRPSRFYLDKLIKHNANFINDGIQVAQALPQIKKETTYRQEK